MTICKTVRKNEQPLCSSRRDVPWWLLTNVISFDAAIVAVVWNLLFSSSLHVRHEPSVPLALGCSVWLIYLVDHVLDVGRSPSPPAADPPRKVFVRRNRPTIVLLAILGTLLTAVFAWKFLEPAVFRAGLGGAAVVAVYFGSVHLLPPESRRRWPRESVVAFLFACGVCMPVAIDAVSRRAELLAAGLVFFLFCWLNCSAVEVWEWQAAGQSPEGEPCLSTQWMANHFMAVTGAILPFSLLLTWQRILSPPIEIAVLISALAFLTIGYFGSRTHLALRCVLVDLALWSPILILCFAPPVLRGPWISAG